MRKKQYPVKQDLNLAQRERTGRKTGITILTALLLAAAVGLFCKFGVIDRLAAVNEAEAAAAQTESTLAKTQEATARYDEVMEEYRSYTLAHRATDTGADPLECLDLVENGLIEKSQVSGFNIAGGVISVQLSGVTLKEISVIYTGLLQSDLVADIQVYTAATTEQSGDQVQATMTIRLAAAGEEEPS